MVVAGDLVLDLVVQVPERLHRGSDTWGALHPRQGGSVANTAAWLARLGVPVVFCGRVGRDPLGHALVVALEAEGVEVRAVPDDQAPTGVILALVGPDGEKSMVIGPGANHRLEAGDLPPGLVEGAGLCYLTGYSFFWEDARDAARAVMARALEAGVPVAVDASSAALLARQGAEGVLQQWQGVSILFANEEEAALLAGGIPGDEAAERLGGLLPVVGIKAGPRGAWGVAWGRRWRVEALPVPRVVDTTGCGDAWNAGMLAGLRAGLDPEAAARLGRFVAAWVAQRPGAVPPGWTAADRQAAWDHAREPSAGGGRP
ncbi:sugar kinase, ribokinase [Thermaerobacter subterraneus DSM 13965]|uniref:Sugar kinase, ribokinase n=1 Tax=Thermaerobacter subterraneus DSM 13965 TaxID=867903 RepID=K6Q2V2_9FIRM|nr:sugar kinase, ribokinase [Thermaerobacter subterraneus DSM 13965]